MKKFNTVHLILFIFILFFSVFFVSAEEPININNNTTNDTNLTSSNFTNQSLAAVPLAADDKIGIEVYWDGVNGSDINFRTLLADGSTYQFSGEAIVNTGKNPTDLYVRASGDFLDGNGDIISLNNFKYANYGNRIITPTSFTTYYTLVIDKWKNNEDPTVYADLYLTMPPSTEPGTYTVTIYHAAVKSNEPAPIEP